MVGRGWRIVERPSCDGLRSRRNRPPMARYRPPLPVSPTKLFHVFRVCRIIRGCILDDAATILHQVMDRGPGRSLCRGLGLGGLKYAPEPLLDEIFEVAAAQRCLRLGAAIQF